MLWCGNTESTRFAPRRGVMAPAIWRGHDLAASEKKSEDEQQLGRWRG